ncbi:filamentous hemagglutinin N-terminal domain-containing protein [uncultured Succinivibrio sp.]|uniref:two-partner secretion domain-containing protein n=1 Tax=uncultured Succinivibrio sp. TaxID=540749 RepID=UPI0025EAA05E|nr:filamentous hemagglutinin N-terminal domain-containing protein [uncultured Succinivibrio sp.]
MNKLIKLLPVFTGMLLGCAYASDILPGGARILTGDATIINKDKTQVIFSLSERNVISWEDFSVGSENRVLFDNHQYLNLVHGSKASVIDGYIGFSANGNSAFYLVNPNGITLGRNSEIHAARIALSTSKISEKTVSDFIDSGELNLSYKGMGKIRLIGKISTGNLRVDGSQIIIRDIEDISRDDLNSKAKALTNTDGDNLEIRSSTKRIDIGGRKELDIENTYKLKKEDGLIDHTGETALSTKEDFSKIRDNTSGSYFVTNDVELGEINRTLDDNKGFNGSLDGAYNTVSYTLKSDSKAQQDYGLFSKLDGATVENLKLKDSSVNIDTKASEVYAGALCGRMKDSRVENVEVENFDIQNKYNSPVTIYTGDLSGMLEKGYTQNSLSNVSTSFSDKSYERFNSYDYYVRGSLAGVNASDTKLSGYMGRDSKDKLSFFGDNRSSKNYSEDYSDTSGRFIKRGEGYSNIGFYAPFFVDEDIEIVYSKDNPQSYEYSSFTDNPHFKTENYVNVAYDYEGNISEPALYTHTYSSKTEGTEFYFVKNNEASLTVPHYVKVIDPTVRIPATEDISYHGDNLKLYEQPRYVDISDAEPQFKDEKYECKRYKATLSFMDRVKINREMISPRLIASLHLDNEPSERAKTYAYKRSEKEKTS